MKLHGYKLVILSCELSNMTQKLYLFSFSSLSTRLFILFGLGLMFLVYPFLGHLADVYLTRYRMLKLACIILICGISATIVYRVVDIIVETIWSYEKLHKPETMVVHVVVVLFIVYIIGLGLFEANAIQFGLDQLLEAPTPKLISFIHWYTGVRIWQD